ncbi:putative O-methyltransferase YrrM [Methylosinus sp. sav-2]|uniref:O-methyltransferase n=1 Tax=Methylosinus sp. sav-2 TaxID=2485168 RepID=UPI0004799150|nr:O-methyltransferase [Methylosinus sp. sav-2]TDX65789.1 putative O-methyltransferase YrrM [Methylosinus sp. sav-2]
MSSQAWSEVDAYIADRLIGADADLDSALSANAAAGLPAIDVSPPQGKLLHLLARSIGAKRILEVGALGGYSTIWLARALPEGGRLVTLELEQKHADVAAANLAKAGLASRVEIRVGAALDTLPKLAAEAAGPFDLAFIDADKPNNANYFAWALRLARPGSLIIVDNVVREGSVLAGTDANAAGARALFEAIAAEPRVTATAVQTVGSKGWDGFAIAIVNG